MSWVSPCAAVFFCIAKFLFMMLIVGEEGAPGRLLSGLLLYSGSYYSIYLEDYSHLELSSSVS